MRADFVKAVTKVLENDPLSTFITGDLGYLSLEKIAEQFKNRFLNAGVAEQNMTGVAAGFALNGFKPWIYSITPFLTYRCLEQIRNDICLHNLPVRLVGNGGGYTYGIMGSTHHALEDIAVLKCLPNITLFFPCTNAHVTAAVDQMNSLLGPTYLRLAISGFSTEMQPLSENPATLTRHYAQGSKLTVIGVGHATQVALHALTKQSDKMSDIDVFGIARFPFSPELDAQLTQSVLKTRKVIVLDEHYQAGSMGETLKLLLPQTDSFDLMCAHYSPHQKYGSSTFHLKQCGLTPEALTQLIQERTKS